MLKYLNVHNMLYAHSCILKLTCFMGMLFGNLKQTPCGIYMNISENMKT